MVILRNHRKRGFIDARDGFGTQSSETANSFIVKLCVNAQNIETQKFTMRKAAFAKTVTEQHRTFWPRFVAAVHLPVGGRREVEIKGLAGEHIVVHHWSEGLPAFEFNGLLAAFDIAPHDTIVLVFMLDSGKITCVDVTIDEAKDKEITRELEELLATERLALDEERHWAALELLIRRAFAATRLIAVQGHVSVCQLDFGPASDFYSYSTYVEWSWLSPDKLEVQMSASRDIDRFPTDTREDFMAALGWSVPSIADFYERENDDPFEFFTITLDDPSANNVVKLLVQSLRHGFRLPITDDVLVRPEVVADMTITSPSDSPEQRLKNRRGLLTPVELHTWHLQMARGLSSE